MTFVITIIHDFVINELCFMIVRKFHRNSAAMLDYPTGFLCTSLDEAIQASREVQEFKRNLPQDRWVRVTKKCSSN